MLNYFWIMIGGALGTGARVWVAEMMASRFGVAFPYGTLLVNISGSFLIGLFAGLIDPAGATLVSPRTRQFVMIGICGGYTTFSSFSLQTLDLARDGDWMLAVLYTVLSVVCCLLAVWLGRSATLLLFSR